MWYTMVSPKHQACTHALTAVTGMSEAVAPGAVTSAPSAEDDKAITMPVAPLSDPLDDVRAPVAMDAGPGLAVKLKDDPENVRSVDMEHVEQVGQVSSHVVASSSAAKMPDDCAKREPSPDISRKFCYAQ